MTINRPTLPIKAGTTFIISTGCYSDRQETTVKALKDIDRDILDTIKPQEEYYKDLSQELNYYIHISYDWPVAYLYYKGYIDIDLNLKQIDLHYDYGDYNLEYNNYVVSEVIDLLKKIRHLDKLANDKYQEIEL